MPNLKTTLNRPETLSTRVNITSSHTSLGMPHNFRQLDIRNLPGVVGAEGVAVAVKNDPLPALRADIGTITETVHLPNEAVLGVGISVFVAKDAIGGQVRSSGQPATHPYDSRRQRNHPRPGFPLPGDGLVFRDDPEFLFQVYPLPNKASQFAWPAAGQPQGDQESPEVSIGLTQKRTEFLAGDDPGPTSSRRLPVSRQGRRVDQLVLHCPVQDTLTGPTLLKKLQITKSDSSRTQQVASLPKATFNRYVWENVAAGHEPTMAGLLRLVKHQNVQHSVAADTTQHERLVRDLRELIAAGRRFATIYADPPWPYDNQATRAATGNHYPTMTLDEVAAQPVEELAAKNAHLHLWTTNSFLPAALDVIRAWGFTFKGTFIWCKSQMGTGNYWRVSHELLLLGVRGSLPFRDHGQRSWMELERRGHSVKPPEVRELIEKTSPPDYLELFAREVPENPAWTVYGNQFGRRT